MSDCRFADSSGPSVGVELELQILNPRTLALDGSAGTVLESVPGEFRHAIKPEYYDCCVEIATEVCRDVDEARRDLGGKLQVVDRLASRSGSLIAWGGSHPISHWTARAVVPAPRYLELESRYRDTLHRQLTFGLHVHVGAPDGDSAVRACVGLAEHLPILLALSANSPFWCGRATGLHSNRLAVMDASPTSGPAPRLDGWSDYARFVHGLTSSGLVGSAKELWWDARPSPENGTVEVRICDMPPDLDSALALAALIQCLTVELGRTREPAGDDYVAAVVRQNRWRASRYGMAAEFVDSRTGRKTPAADAVRRLADRLTRIASDLNCVAWLERAASMAGGISGAERQLAAFERTGDLLDVVRRAMLPDPAASVFPAFGTVPPGPGSAPAAFPADPEGCGAETRTHAALWASGRATA